MGLLESTFASGVLLDVPEPDLGRWDDDALGDLTIPAFTRERPSGETVTLAARRDSGDAGEAPRSPDLPIVDCPGCGCPTVAATYDSRTQTFTPAAPLCHACRAAE